MTVPLEYVIKLLSFSVTLETSALTVFVSANKRNLPKSWVGFEPPVRWRYHPNFPFFQVK